MKNDTEWLLLDAGIPLDKFTHILIVAVDEQHRKHKIAARMMLHALRNAKSQDRHVFLTIAEGNTAASTFYKRMGAKTLLMNAQITYPELLRQMLERFFYFKAQDHPETIRNIKSILPPQSDAVLHLDNLDIDKTIVPQRDVVQPVQCRHACVKLMQRGALAMGIGGTVLSIASYYTQMRMLAWLPRKLHYVHGVTATSFAMYGAMRYLHAGCPTIR